MADDPYARIAELEAEIAELREQQSATAEVLRVIATSPTDLQSVLDTIADSARRLCNAGGAHITRLHGDVLRVAALSSTSGEERGPTLGRTYPLSKSTPAGRAILERRPVQVEDVDSAETRTDFPDYVVFSAKTTITAPLISDGVAIGTIGLARLEARPFSPGEVALLQTFADQAVIAIENARLFSELERRNAELQESNRQVTEALEQQTTTAEVLRVIASSPTDLASVLQSVVESASRLCSAANVGIWRAEGADMVRMANSSGTRGAEAGTRAPLTREMPSGRVILDGRTIHLLDMAALLDDEFPEARRVLGSRLASSPRTYLSVPLLREGAAIGAMSVERAEVRAFTEGEIALLETFADQAMIAIENARLFEELQESNRQLTEALERQTATADVLRVISRSTFDLQVVLDTLLESAAKLCHAKDGSILRSSAESFYVAAWFHFAAEVLDYYEAHPESLRPGRGSAWGRAVLERRTVHIPDVLADPEYEQRDLQRVGGYRTVLAVPLLREGNLVGVFALARTQVEPFTAREIALVESFADQAVIAIENARLFQELQDRVGELQALGEVGQAVSSSLDLQHVLTTIVTHAIQLSGTDGGVIYEYDDAADVLHARATLLFDDELTEVLQASQMRLGEGAVGRAIAAREPVQVSDLLVEGAYSSQVRDALVKAGHRALLAVPLLREGRVLGSLGLARRSVGDFSPAVVTLVQTFAAQSALAIENAQLFQDLEVQGRALEEASRHKSQFLANMSHELRTPLNAIIGYSEMLQEEAEDLDEQTFLPDLQKINAAGRHLLGLINDILDLSKIEAGRMDLFLETFEIGRLVRDVEAIVQPLLDKNSNTMVVECPDDIGPCRLI